MNQFICWTNNNQGLVAAIFSAITLLFSGLSVWIAIVAIKAPYKKKAFIKVKINENIQSLQPPIENIISFDISFVNTGNRYIVLDEFGLLVGDKYIENNLCFNNVEKKVPPAETRTINIGLINFRSQFSQIEDNHNQKYKKIYGYAKDSEGEVHKKRMKRIEKIISINSK